MFTITPDSLNRYAHHILKMKNGWEFPTVKPRTEVTRPGTGAKAVISRSPLTITDTSSTYWTALDRLAEQGYKVNRRYAAYIKQHAKAIIALIDNENKADAIKRHMLDILNADKFNKVIYNEAFYDTRGRTYHMSGETLSLQTAQISRWALAAPDAYAVTPAGHAHMLKIFEHEGWPTNLDDAKKILEKPSTDFGEVRAAITIIEIEEDGVTDYLLEQDASCSGFQMMGLIMNDHELLRATNVIKGDTRGDLYVETAKAGNVANDLFGGNMRQARQFCKKVVMLTGYGSGHIGLSHGIWEDQGGPGCYESDDSGELVFVPDTEITITIGSRTFNISELEDYCKDLQKMLYERFPSVKRLRDICVKIFTEQMKLNNDKLFKWVSPDGFDCRRYITAHEQFMALVKQAGAMPNIVHSVDACIVRYVLNHFCGEVIGVVHDAFFTTINDALSLQQCIQEAYRKLCGQSVAGLDIEYNGVISGPCVGL